MVIKLQSMAPIIATLSFLVYLLDQTNASSREQSALAPEELALCREAWIAWKDRLHSGSGDGVFEEFANGKSNTKAKVKICFATNRYRIEMNFQKSSEKDTKQITIYNNDKVLFHVRYFPVNSEIEIREGNCYDIDDAYRPPVTVGFPFSPCHPIMAVGSTVMESPQLTLQSVRRNGDLVLRYQNQNIHLEIEASKQYGYNISHIRSYRDGFNSPLGSREEIIWEKQTGIWYIKSIDRECFFFKSGKPTGSQLCRLSYSNFTVNPDLDKNTFAIDSAGLPEGARILDNRPQSTNRVYHYTRNRERIKDDGGILSDVIQLPRERKDQSNMQRPLSSRERSNPSLRIALSISGVVFLLLGVMVWCLKLRATNKKRLFDEPEA